MNTYNINKIFENWDQIQSAMEQTTIPNFWLRETLMFKELI